MTGRALLKLLKGNGWRVERIRGSHHIMIKGAATTIVPVHGSREVSKETLHAILKEAGIR